MLAQRRSGSLALLWQRLTNPAAVIQSSEEKRRARLLASLQLALIPLTTLILILWRAVEPVNQNLVLPVAVVALGVMVVVYWLSRTRHYRLGVMLLIAQLFAAILIVLTNTKQPYTDAAASTIDFLAIAVLLASVLLSVRQTIIVAMLGLVAVLFLPLMLPGLLPITLFGRFTFLTITSAFVVTVALLRRRDQEQFEQQSLELAASEARSRATFEQAAVGIAHTSSDGRWLRVNQKLCDIVGYTREELLELSWQDITYPDDLNADMEQARLLLAGDIQTYAIEKRYICHDGSLIWVNVTVSLLRTPSDDAPSMIGIIQEITERKHAEEALRASEERYRLVTELISDYAYSFTIEPDGTFVHEWLTEDSFRRITGYTQEEIDARGNFALFHPDDAPQVERSLAALLRGESSGGEVRIITRSGEVRWLHIYRRPLWDPAQKRVIQVFGVAQDITERKRADEALLATNRMLETSRDTLSRLIQQIPIGIQVFDASGLCTDVNQAHLDIFGVANRDQLVGRYNLFEDSMAESVGTAAGARRALAGETVHLGDLSFDFAHADPRFATTRGQRSVSVSFFPVLDENGQIANIVALNQDTTARKRAQSQQVELAVEKERVQMLQHFIRDTSHDLRTPLTTIKTSLYLLERTLSDQAKRERYITIINDQAARLHQLLEDLLSLSRLDKSSIEEFSFEMRSLNLLLQSVVAGQNDLVRAKNHNLTLSVEPDLPPILVDDAQLNRAITNILINALNYTPDGGVIGVRAFQRDDRIAVEIQDNGIGIRKEDLAHIFDRFYRADAARSTDSGGVGLGLTIARRIIEAHGGDIEVESEAGQGTKVRVWLPVVGERLP